MGNESDIVILAATGIERTYRRGDIALPVLYDLDLQVRRGEWVACTGRSGSGKSTLLHVSACSTAPTAALTCWAAATSAT